MSDGISSVDALLKAVCGRLLHGSEERLVSGRFVRDALGVTLCLDNPRARMSASMVDKDYSDAASHLEKTLAGEDLLGRRLFGAPQTFGVKRRPSQWDNAVTLLTRDRHDPMAVMTVYAPSDTGTHLDDDKDVPYLLSLQFIIKNDQLHLHVTSSMMDVKRLARDVFKLTLLQEIMLLDLRITYPDLQLGQFYWTIGVALLNSSDNRWAESVLAQVDNCKPMSPAGSREDLCRLKGAP